MEPVTFIAFKWRPPQGYRSTFGPKHVDVLRRMIRRHYHGPHRFMLITDDHRGLEEEDIECRQIWDYLAKVPNPSGRGNPSCYRRLAMFASNVGEWAGERFCVLDLDMVITGDITPLFAGGEDFKIWKSTTVGNPYNGSMWMLRAGARTRVWEDFNEVLSPRATRAAGFFGSDQAWMALSLGPNEATWGPLDGVFSYRVELAPHNGRLPAGARMVSFHGRVDPWSAEAQRLGWVREHYR